jgi:hypothetical protein
MIADRVLVVKGRCGFGNRLLSALTGILYAHLAGRRLVIDWRDPCYALGGENAFHRFFTSHLFGPDDAIPAGDSVAPEVWRGRLNDNAVDVRGAHGSEDIRHMWKHYSIDLGKLDYPENVAVMWTFIDKLDPLRPHMTGEWALLREAPREAILRKLLRENLQLKPDIHTRVDDFARRHLSSGAVGVHVRYSDHRAQLWSILSALDGVIAHSPELKVFLATDNIEIKRLFEEVYPGVVSTPHWYPKAGLGQHHAASGIDPREAGVEALIDMYLLARCDWLIVDRSSSFSTIAVLLSDAPAGQVIDLRRRSKPARAKPDRAWRMLLKLGFYTWGLRAATQLYKLQRYAGRLKHFQEISWLVTRPKL